MVKAAAALLLLPLASAFVAPAAKLSRGRSLKMTFGYDEEGARPVGGVQFFPWDDQKYWVSGLQP